jgi:hypothetical protein
MPYKEAAKKVAYRAAHREERKSYNRRYQELQRINCVYALIDPLTEELFYVGFTNRPGPRLAEHKKSPKRPYGGRRVKDKIAEIQRRGAQPSLYILERTRNRKQEKIWIYKLRMLGYPLLNKAVPGGISYSGTKAGREYQREWRAKHPRYHKK